MNLNRIHITGFFSFLWVTSVIADPVAINPRPRMQSMGNAGLALPGGRDSASVNPAGLNDVKERDWVLLPALVEIPFEVDLLSSFLDYDDARDGNNRTAKEEALEKFLRDVASTATAMRVNLYPSFTMKNFHIGLLIDAYVDPRFRVGGLTANQMIELGGAAGMAGLIVGGSYSFLNNSLQVGVTLKPLYKMAITKNQTQTIHDILLGQNDDGSIVDEIFGKNKLSRRGFGFGADLGVKYKLPFFQSWKPTIGITYQDIGNARFANGAGDIDQSVSVGFGVNPSFKFMELSLAMDLRNIQEEQEFLNKLHFGTELKFWKMLAIRGGLGQGYLSGGVGIDLPFFELDAYINSYEAGRYAHVEAIRTVGLRIAATL